MMSRFVMEPGDARVASPAMRQQSRFVLGPGDVDIASPDKRQRDDQKTTTGLRLELKRTSVRRWDPDKHPRDHDGQFADIPGVGNDAPKPDARRFATRTDDARRAQGQTKSNFVHPVTGHAMGKTEVGDTYEALFETKGAPLLVDKYGGEYTAVATTGGWQSRNTPLDFQVGDRGGELKSLSSRTQNQKTAIKAEEIARKHAAVTTAGLKPLLVVQVIDQDSGTVQVYAYEEFASKSVKKMDHLGSYEYSLDDFEAAQMRTGHHDKREQRAADQAAAAKAATLVDDDGNAIEPGDLVIELRDGVPYVYTFSPGKVRLLLRR